MRQIYGIYRNAFLPSATASETRSIERLGRRSPYMNLVNDLREELLRTKRIYTIAICENSLLRTKLKVAEKERRRREDEITDLLDTKNENLVQLGSSKYEDRIQLNLMRKKLLHYERTLRERTEQNAELITDQSVLKMDDLRKRLRLAESDCIRLKKSLAQSVPEAEHLREKHQYMKVIDRLTEENIQLRKLIDAYEMRHRDVEQILERVYGGADLVKEFRDSGITTKKQAEFYKNALNTLVNNTRRFKIALKNRSNSESGVTLRQRRRKLAGLNKDAHNEKLPLLPSITDANLKSQQNSNQPLSVIIPTRGSVKATCAGNSTQSPPFHGVIHTRRKLGKMSISLDNPEFCQIIPRMYNNMSGDDSNDAEDEAQQAADNSQHKSDSSRSDSAVPRLVRRSLVNREENDSGEEHHSSASTPRAIIYGNSGAVESGAGSNTFIISGRLSGRNSNSKPFISNAAPKFSGIFFQDSEVEKTTDKDYLVNIEALKSEYYDALKVNEQKAGRSMDKIVRAVQCHLLRLKMLGIREPTLNEYGTSITQLIN